MVVIFNRNQAASAFPVLQKAADGNAAPRPNKSEKQQRGSRSIQDANQPQQRKTHLRRYIAQRFKITLCEKFETTGSCPYGHRCMFAHGATELRTAEMNVRDRLTTLEAIESFRRAATARNRGELAELHHATAPQQYPRQPLAARTPLPQPQLFDRHQNVNPRRLQQQQQQQQVSDNAPSYHDWGLALPAHETAACTCAECTAQQTQYPSAEAYTHWDAAPQHVDPVPPPSYVYSHNPYGMNELGHYPQGY